MHRSRPAPTPWWGRLAPRWGLAGCGALVLTLATAATGAWADDSKVEKPNFIGKIALPAKPEAPAASAPAAVAQPAAAGKASIGQQLREAIEQANSAPPAKPGKPAKGKAAEAAKVPKAVLAVDAEPKRAGKLAGAPAAPPDVAAAYARAHGYTPNPVDSKAATRAAALASVRRGGASPVAAVAATAPPAVAMPSSDAQWAYDGVNGPQSWAKLTQDYNLCAQGTRQSPIDIQDGNTLLGPAEPLQVHYQPSSALVVNTSRTIQVNVVGDNTLTVRGSTYKLVQIIFHSPSEERINGRPFPMAAHLMHRDEDGKQAVIAVLLQPGQPNPMIHKVWTYMPLDVGDRVRMPPDLLDLNELMPQDMRYYQYMGSLTTPPCTEGVLWMVMKQPVQISPEQLRLFNQLYAFNARPVQPLNGRVVRNAE